MSPRKIQHDKRACNTRPWQAPDSYTTTDGQKADPFLLLSRNLTNYPVTRDAKTKLDWKASKSGDFQWCRISPSTSYWWKGKTPSALSPMAEDIAFMLIRQVLPFNKREFKYKLSGILDLSGYAISGRNCDNAVKALRQLYRLHIRFKSWYDSATKITYQRDMPPFLEKLEREGNTITLTIDPEWFQVIKGLYAARFPYPVNLPRSATTRNLVKFLCGRVIRKKTHREFFLVDTLYEKAGLEHNTRTRSLEMAVGDAAQWFKRSGGELSFDKTGRGYKFKITPPPTQN